jgi:Zn-dependent peptidase ImmA (M78 family)
MALQKNEMETMSEDFRKQLGLDIESAFDPFLLKVENVEIVAISKLKDFDKRLLAMLTGEASHQWSAMSVPLDLAQEKWVIVYNDSHNPERQRVSVLEEVWHILSGHRLTKIVRLGAHHSRTYEHQEEHDAYYLASASLVPAEAVRNFVKEKGDLLEFARRYGASKELIEYRIKRLGLWYHYKERKISLAKSARLSLI